MRSSLILTLAAALAATACTQEPAPVAVHPEVVALCDATVESLQKAGTLYSVTLQQGEAPRVLVGPRFFLTSIDDKAIAAKMVSCKATGHSGAPCADFDVLHWQTGKAVGRFEACKLKLAL